MTDGVTAHDPPEQKAPSSNAPDRDPSDENLPDPNSGGRDGPPRGEPDAISRKAREHRFAEIEAALEDAAADPDDEKRQRVRESIIALFHDTEAAIAELSEFKESIRPLVVRYKALPSPQSAAASEISADEIGAAPRDAPGNGAGGESEGVRGKSEDGSPTGSRRIDHLGSATHAERAWSAIAERRPALAIEAASRALDLAPGNALATTLLAWARIDAGEPERGREILEEHLGREPEDALAAACLGYATLRLDDPVAAEAHLARALRSKTDRKARLYAHLFRGMSLIERKLYADARESLARALEDGPNLIEAQWQMGRSHYLEGNPGLAAEAWRDGAEMNAFNVWGERCRAAAERVGAGEPVSFD